MTPSVETAASADERDLRFAKVVSVHEADGEVVIVFRDAQGDQRRVIFPASEERFLLECFVRLHGGLE